MAMMVRSIAPLDGEAVLSLATVKVHLKVEDDGEDLLIGAFRDAALDWVERHTGKSLAVRGWEVTFDRFEDRLRLPREPVSAVTAVGYLEANGNAAALAMDRWRLAGASVVAGAAGTWPLSIAGDAAVTVSFAAGYVNAKAEAPGLIAAALMVVGHLFRNREDVITGTIATSIPFGAVKLCEAYRTPVFA